MLLHNFLTQSALKYPDREAVIHQDKRMTYAQLSAASDSLCRYFLSRNIENGDRIALLVENCPEYVVPYFAALKAGAVVVPLNSQLTANELIHPLNDCAPRIVVTDKKHLPAVEQALSSCSHACTILLIEDHSDLFFGADADFSVDRGPLSVDGLNENSLALIIYTSGTTGKPKGVMLSHGNLCANAGSIIEYLGITSQDKIMVILPFYYSYGNSLLTTHIKAGGTLVLDNRFVFPNTVLNTMRDEKVTGFAGVPSHFAMLLRKSALRQYSFPDLRYVTQAGGGMPPAMIREFREIFPAVDFVVMYGQTEASARLSYLSPDMVETKTGSIGKAIPGVELKVRDGSGRSVIPGEMGEIVARGDNVMKGYWNSPEETEKVLKNGFLYTGDLARIDEDGFIYIVSRKKEMIKSGANRISPLEIEDTVCQLSQIVECAAVGMPDELMGEVIKLFVVKRDGRAVEARDILLHCKENLAAYKIPKEIEFVDSLPKTASGKIKRRLLAEKTAKQAAPADSV